LLEGIERGYLLEGIERGPRFGALEIGPGRARRRNGIGLALKPADRDPRHILPVPTLCLS
jgi:hypothetical protein